MWGARDLVDAADIEIFALGFVASFFSAFVVMRALLKFISNHTFMVFAWYRIAFGLLILLTAYSGAINWVA